MSALAPIATAMSGQQGCLSLWQQAASRADCPDVPLDRLGMRQASRQCVVKDSLSASATVVWQHV